MEALLCLPGSPADTSSFTGSTVSIPPLSPPPPNYTWPLPRCGAHHPKTLPPDAAPPLDIRDSDDPVLTLWRGTAEALWTLVDGQRTNAQPPPLLDEFHVPLCERESPLASLPWTETGAPRQCDAETLVVAVIRRLSMTPRCVVTAMVLLETTMRQRSTTAPPLLCARSARPLFLASCILALKFTYDAEVVTRECFDCMEDLFTGVVATDVARMEEQMLRWIDWRIPNDPRVYELYARELVRAGLRPGQTLDATPVPAMF